MMKRFATLGALCGVLVLPAGQAFAQEGQAIRALFGAIGLLTPEREQIEYRERAPLVLPPNMALKSPADPDVSKKNPNWPTDPDVIARQKAAAYENMPATEREKYAMHGQKPLLSQEELRKGRIAGRTPTEPYRSSLDDSPYEIGVKPIIIGKEIAARRAAANTEAMLAREEPPRRYLSDPPVGLRKPAAGAAAGKLGEDPKPRMQATNDAVDFVTQEAKN